MLTCPPGAVGSPRSAPTGLCCRGQKTELCENGVSQDHRPAILLQIFKTTVTHRSESIGEGTASPGGALVSAGKRGPLPSLRGCGRVLRPRAAPVHTESH